MACRKIAYFLLVLFASGCVETRTPIAPIDIELADNIVLEPLSAALSHPDSVFWNGDVLEYFEAGDEIRWIRDQQHATKVHFFRNNDLEMIVDFIDVDGQLAEIRVGDPSDSHWYVVDSSGIVQGASAGCFRGICPESSPCSTERSVFIGSAGVAFAGAAATVALGVISVRVPATYGMARTAATTTQNAAGASLLGFGAYLHCLSGDGGGDDGGGEAPCRPGDDCEVQPEEYST